MPVANPDPSINLETHVFQENEALLYVPIYNKVTGLYVGLTKKLAYITLRGDTNERFFFLWVFKREKQCVVLYHEDASAKHFSLCRFQKTSWVYS